MSDSIFQANGSPEDQAKLLAPISKIFFPWTLLQPELLRSTVGHVQLEFADLSHFGAAIDIQGEREDHIVDDEGNVGHIMYSEHLPDEFHAAALGNVAGLAWYGKVQVEQVYKNNQAMIDWVISAEIAHQCDYFYINVHGMRPALTALVHPSGPDNHPWFEGDYWQQVGEGWMAGFGVAYSDFVQPDTRFVHVFTREMIPRIHEILHAERTDKEKDEPPPDPTARPEITNVKPKGSRKTRIIGVFDPGATLAVNGRLSDAGVDGDRFTLRKLNAGRYEFVVTNPNGKSSAPYVYNVV